MWAGPDDDAVDRGARGEDGDSTGADDGDSACAGDGVGRRIAGALNRATCPTAAAADAADDSLAGIAAFRCQQTRLLSILNRKRGLLLLLLVVLPLLLHRHRSRHRRHCPCHLHRIHRSRIHPPDHRYRTICRQKRKNHYK